MKKLLVDAGNSGIKWAVVETTPVGNSLSKMKSILYGKSTPLQKLKEVFEEERNNFELDEIVFVSVLGEDYFLKVKQLLKEKKIKFTQVMSVEDLAGVKSAYTEPHKLGADRLVAMIGAYHLNKNRPSIIVDSGTATTIDAIDKDGQHLGGIILPGVNLCSQSLLQKSEVLAILNENKRTFEPDVFATDTKQAIDSGSIFGQAGAIKNICSIMEQEIQKKNNTDVLINKLICGGSASKLLSYLPEEFEYEENLLMLGLKIISEIKTKPN